MSIYTRAIEALALAMPLLFCGPSPGSGQEPGREQAAGTMAAAQAPQRDDLLDINTASAAALRALPGMGDAYVRRVIEGRPYLAKNQLVTLGVLPPEEYRRIRDLVIAHRVPRH